MNRTYQLLVDKQIQLQHQMFEELNQKDRLSSYYKSYDTFVKNLNDITTILAISSQEMAGYRTPPIHKIFEWVKIWKQLRALESGNISEDEILLEKLTQ